MPANNTIGNKTQSTNSIEVQVGYSHMLINLPLLGLAMFESITTENYSHSLAYQYLKSVQYNNRTPYSGKV